VEGPGLGEGCCGSRVLVCGGEIFCEGFKGSGFFAEKVGEGGEFGAEGMCLIQAKGAGERSGRPRGVLEFGGEAGGLGQSGEEGPVGLVRRGRGVGRGLEFEKVAEAGGGIFERGARCVEG